MSQNAIVIESTQGSTAGAAQRAVAAAATAAATAPQMAQAASNGREPVREFMVRGTKFEVAEKYGLIKVSASVC